MPTYGEWQQEEHEVIVKLTPGTNNHPTGQTPFWITGGDTAPRIWAEGGYVGEIPSTMLEISDYGERYAYSVDMAPNLEPNVQAHMPSAEICAWMHARFYYSDPREDDVWGIRIVDGQTVFDDTYHECQTLPPLRPDRHYGAHYLNWRAYQINTPPPFGAITRVRWLIDFPVVTVKMAYGDARMRRPYIATTPPVDFRGNVASIEYDDDYDYQSLTNPPGIVDVTALDVTATTIPSPSLYRDDALRLFPYSQLNYMNEGELSAVRDLWRDWWPDETGTSLAVGPGGILTGPGEDAFSYQALQWDDSGAPPDADEDWLDLLTPSNLNEDTQFTDWDNWQAREYRLVSLSDAHIYGNSELPDPYSAAYWENPVTMFVRLRFKSTPWRWVFPDTVFETKPRARIYPRDDQGRLYPTPTAIQTPGRLFPGYR